MRSRLSLGLLAAVLFAIGGHPHPRTEWKVGLRGIGPVRYGMSVSTASRVLGESLKVELLEPQGDCGDVAPAGVPEGVSFMVIDTLVERVDVLRGSVTTVSGAHIGSTEEEVKALYPGRIQVQPHPYDAPEGHYLVYVPRDPADSNFRIIFETDGKKVTMYRAGRRPAVEYIEGCA